MNTQHQLAAQLRILKLGGFLESLDVRLQQAREEEIPHLEFLQRLVQDEIERREAKKLVNRIKSACFEEEKTLEGFDFSFNPKIRKSLHLGSFHLSFCGKERTCADLRPGGCWKDSYRPGAGAPCLPQRL